ncbi:hypothetical protein ACFP2F_09475 [Hymenobacter artigasi]|uniref:Lipoprotein n=1 Tax=Hymenobacter artigasi TaxID=2719616 RepID=A0ABX1HHN2_9BACT|nr:hypothetical protein [Hymenobacter artigasi]NKI89758.1 hypothetical protein [Hymenobacter artigasi]
MHFLSKQARISFLSLFLLTGCQDKSTDTAQSVTKPHTAIDSVTSPRPAATPVTSAADAITQQMRPLLGGAWLNTTYAAYLQKTRSPRRAQGHWDTSGITEILIDSLSFKGDSMAVAIGAANHEGLPLRYVHLRKSTAANSWPTTSNAEEIGDDLLEISFRHQIHNADTLLYLDQRNKKTGRVTTTAFQRLRGSSGAGAALQSPPLQIPLSRFVNGLSFAGTHSMNDSTGRVSSVHFTADGNVQGLPGYKTYQVNTDFEGPFHELDTVFLDIYKKTQAEFAFAANGDTIRLYTVHDDTTTYKRQRGRLRYTLIRKSRN